MARNLYGCTSADFAQTSTGRMVAGAGPFPVFDAFTGGAAITDLTDLDGNAITQVTFADDGYLRYYSPDNDKRVHWLDTGQGRRIGVRPVNLTGETGLTPDLSIGTVTTGAADVVKSGTLEAPVFSFVLPSAGVNGVNTAALQDNAVTADKIAADAVGSSEIAANAVGTAKIADGAVTSAKIADGTIATGDLADGAVTPAKLATTGRFTFPTGAANGYGFASGAVHLSGTGTPEGVIIAAPGSTFLQTNSVTDVKGWIRWVKATGTGSTGWVAGPEADTGWRAIVSWTSGVQDDTNQIGTIDTNQYTLSGNGYIYIRRIGQYVEWWMRGVINKTNTGIHKLFTVDNRIPAGFRAEGGLTYGISVPFTAHTEFLGSYGIGDTPAINAVASNAVLSYYSCRHFTANPWPTSLLGVTAA